MERIEMDYAASPERVWELWTTAEGIERWWAPDGFAVTVDELDVRVGGALVYTMTATAPEMVAFMEQNGMPAATQSRKRFTELDAPRRIAYASLVDFVPGAEPYEFDTTVEITPSGTGSHVVMTMEPLHDEEWTQRLVAGRINELQSLAKAL